MARVLLEPMLFRRIYFLLIAFLCLQGCSADRPTGDYAPTDDFDLSTIEEPTPTPVATTRAGNRSPYEVNGVSYTLLNTAVGYRETGIASWYGMKFHGRPTSNGEIFDVYHLTAAHKSLPIPCYARVTRIETGESIVVRINDRGPFVDDRLIDLSWAAAAKLGFVEDGLAEVEIEVISAE